MALPSLTPLRQLLRPRALTQALIFVNSKLGAARLARSFERDGLKTQALHGDKSQDERLKALAAFKAGEVDLLVARDVAARDSWRARSAATTTSAKRLGTFSRQSSTVTRAMGGA